jgi:hypothetical protein
MRLGYAGPALSGRVGEQVERWRFMPRDSHAPEQTPNSAGTRHGGAGATVLYAQQVIGSQRHSQRV